MPGHPAVRSNFRRAYYETDSYAIGPLLKTQPGAQLYFPSSCRGLGNRSELRRIHEPIRRTEIGVVQRIEELPANLKTPLLGNHELPHQRHIQGLQARAVNSIAAHVAKCVSRRHEEGRS